MAAHLEFDERLRPVIEAREHAPFGVLGCHRDRTGYVVRALLPHALRAWLCEGDARQALSLLAGTPIFERRSLAPPSEAHYSIEWEDTAGVRHRNCEPYTFPPEISDYDLYLFGAGSHWHAYRILGAHCGTRDGVDGVRFATWAPAAERVSVVGDFNRWDGRCHPMQVRGGSGVWELFIPGLAADTLYKFEIRNRSSGHVLVKTDPYGRRFELRPATAAIVTGEPAFQWADAEWLERRTDAAWLHKPLSVYEVHLGSWRRAADGRFMNYREMADALSAYCRDLGFTHVELLPVTEHPLDESWGYQTTGYFAATSRFGAPDDLRYLIDLCHQRDLGVILDWAPAHFPRDGHALARFDGSAVYEHEDARRGEHRDWGTLIFNFGRHEVKNLLLSSAFYWLEEFHVDGLRVDAVSSMLYLNYSRQDGDWVPNVHGGVENLDAIAFFKELNSVLHAEHPGCMVIAEESTAWPRVSHPVYAGGLGFSMKWNMGWMHDTRRYLARDPVHRRYHHDDLTFGMLYAYTENYMLPFSHDEVVHGKGSLLSCMPGDDWQRFANLRLLLTYQFTYPGKKLLFMGGEFGERREWDCKRALDWALLAFAPHEGLQRLVRDLNALYRSQPSLHRYDFEPRGFAWLDCHDADHSVLSYMRLADDAHAVVVLNFTPVIRERYRVGVPRAGSYREVLNSNSKYYGGTDVGNGGGVHSEPVPWTGREHSILLTLPPLGGVVLVPASS
jgi:1,4-alpha-glucan branching enzyme